MKDFSYLLHNFFTHKDFLVSADQIPGTLFTPLHFLFSGVLLAAIIFLAVRLSRKKDKIKPVFIGLWISLVVMEFVIVGWESLTARNPGFDLQTNLSLYPCSIFMYVMPFAIWGHGVWKKIACGYVYTLGLLGAAVNFFYPVIRLSSYSCISFAGFHTFFYHGTMLFTFLVMVLSHYYSYRAESWMDLFYPCLSTLFFSIPANIINYTIGADYMFFRGRLDLLASLLPNASDIQVTVLLYVLYVAVPALFFLPSYIRTQVRERRLAVAGA